MAISFTMEELDRFCGSEVFTKHWAMSALLLTDGVAYVAARGVGWLVDLIAARQASHASVLGRESFQQWELSADAQHRGLVLCQDGNGNRLFTETIDATDWPQGQPLELWLVRTNGHRVLMLPREY